MDLIPEVREVLAAANRIKAERVKKFLCGYLDGYRGEPDTALVDILCDYRILRSLNPDLLDVTEINNQADFHFHHESTEPDVDALAHALGLVHD